MLPVCVCAVWVGSVLCVVLIVCGCEYVGVYACVSVRICVYVYIYIFIHTYICMYVRIYMRHITTGS